MPLRRRSSARASIVLLAFALTLAGPWGAGGAVGATTKPTGAVIKVATMGDFDAPAAGTKNPEFPGAVQARAKHINDHGGIVDAAGVRYRIRVIVCNSALDPNKADRCARDAVAQKVVAVIGMASAEEAVMMGILEAAGIPVIAPVAADPSVLSSKVSFPLTCGVAGEFVGMPAALVAAGAKKLSLVHVDAPGAPIPLLYRLGVQAARAQDLADVPVPADATDLAPYVAAATNDGQDGLVTFLLGDSQGNLIRAVHQQGVKVKLAAASPFLTTQLLESLGTLADGVIATAGTRPVTSRSRAVTMFVKDMQAYDKDLPQTDIPENNWLGMWVFERIARGLPKIDASSVLEAMGKIENLDMGGMTPNLSTTKPFSPTNPVFVALAAVSPRLFNPTVVNLVVRKGKLVLLDPSAAADPFVDNFR